MTFYSQHCFKRILKRLNWPARHSLVPHGKGVWKASLVSLNRGCKPYAHKGNSVRGGILSVHTNFKILITREISEKITYYWTHTFFCKIECSKQHGENTRWKAIRNLFEIPSSFLCSVDSYGAPINYTRLTNKTVGNSCRMFFRSHTVMFHQDVRVVVTHIASTAT
jgi:hypothetical protein